ncbi:MAG: hypothetical protein R3B57_10420 [Phycisphaerales bacterium]
MPSDDHDRFEGGEAGDALRRVLTPPGLDPRVRERLLDRAAPELRRRRRAPMFWRLGANAAVAAAILLTTGMYVYFGWLAKGGAPRPTSNTVLTADVNADGVVDILDAHALARAIDAGRPGRDLDADGAITRRDADWIADQVVRLGSAG